MEKLDQAKKVNNLDELKEHMKPGDIMFQGRIRTLEAGLVPNLMSGLMQIGQKANIMHAAMVGHKNKILDYGTGGVAHMKGDVKRGFKRLDLKDMIKGDRVLAMGRVIHKDIDEKKDYIKKFEEMAKEKAFDVSKSLKVGFNKFIGKDFFTIPKEGDFCSTIIHKSIPGLNIKGEATPVDLLNSNKVKIVAVYDPEVNKTAQQVYEPEVSKTTSSCAIYVEGGMEKTAIDVNTIRNVSGKLMDRVVSKNIFDKNRRHSMYARPNKKIMANYIAMEFPMLRQQALSTVNHNDANTFNKIYQSHGGFNRVVSKGLSTNAPKVNSNIDKEVLNRIGIMHEGLELTAKKTMPIATHIHPNVLLRENNIVATLPKQNNQAKNFFTEMRKDTGEANLFPKQLPYGQQRLSRHAIKHVSEQMLNKTSSLVDTIMEKTAFRINKNVLIGAAALTPVTAYVIHHNKRLLPPKTFRGEYARSVAVDIGGDAALTGAGALIGKAFKRPGAGALGGMAAAYFVPAAINTKRMLNNNVMEKISSQAWQRAIKKTKNIRNFKADILGVTGTGIDAEAEGIITN